MRSYANDNGYTFDFGRDVWSEGRTAYGHSGIPDSYTVGCGGIVDDYHYGRCTEYYNGNYIGCPSTLQQKIETEILPECNKAPQVTNPTFAPEYGRTDTPFIFTADYYDEDGDSPSECIVYVNGAPHDMTFHSGAPANGTYRWVGAIPEEGAAIYSVYVNDGRGGEDSTDDVDGPYVYDDYTPPDSSCTAPAATGTNNVTVDYTSSDAKAGVDHVDLYMQFNGAGYSQADSSSDPDGSFSATFFYGNGVYDFYTIGTDRVNNVESPPGTPDASTTYDNTPPVSSADGGTPHYWTGLPIAVDFDANDALIGVDTTTLWYSYNGGAWTDSGLTESGETGTYNFNAPMGEGTYRFYTVSRDQLGNEESAPGAEDVSVVYDATKPLSSCSSIDQTNADVIPIDYTSSDNDEINETRLWYRKDAGAWTDTGLTKTTASGSFNFTFPSGDGTYDFYTISQDKAGNTEDAPASADTSTFLDQTMPQSWCTGPELVNSVPFDVSFTASDAGSGVSETRLYYRFQGQTTWVDSIQSASGESGVFSFDPTLITPEYGDGNYELMTISTDIVGNDEAPPGAPDDTVTLDRTPPASTLECVAQTTTSPLTLDYSADDALSGIDTVRLWYQFNGGDWIDSGLFDDYGMDGYSIASENGTFEFDFPHGDGVYGFFSSATDLAGNVEAPREPDCTCVFDTTPPVTTASTDGVVNDPTITVSYSSTDALTAIASVDLYYRYTDLAGNADDTLRDTGLSESEASGEFVWTPDMGPGYYDFILSATDAADNVEGTEGDADASCLYDPRLALSYMESPAYVQETTVEVTFTIDVGNDGYDHVTLHYRHGLTLAEAEAAAWVTTSTISADEEGTLYFDAPDGDGYYQFFTRAESGSGLLEPMPSVPDGTTIVDGLPPASSVSAPAISPTSEFDVTYTATEAYGLESITISYCHDGMCYDFTTVYDLSGTVTFDAQGSEGLYEFYSIARDKAGNVEEMPPSGHDCTVYVDLTPPTSFASVDSFGTSFPIDVVYGASDTVTEVADVSLWAKFEDGDWENTGLSGSGDSGTLHYTPASALEGAYYFYTVATDEAGHVESVPGAPDDEIMLDWTAPETSCSAPDYASNPVIDVTYTSDDEMSGIYSVSLWIKVGEDPWLDTGEADSVGSGVIQVDVSAWGEGSFGFCTRGRDNAGNVEALPGSVPTTTVYDATAPESAAGLAAGGVFANTTPVNVPYTVTETLSGLDSVELWFRFNGGAWENSGLSDDFSGLSFLDNGAFSFDPASGDGTYEFATRGLDKAGNYEALPGTPDGGALVFDETSPSSSVSYGSSFATDFPITLPFTAEDLTSGIANVALWVSLDGGTYGNTGLTKTGASGNFEYTPDSIAEGTYRFYTIATDNCGNPEAAPAEADATVAFDLTAPVSEAAVASEYTKEFPIKVTFTASDAGSGLVNVKLWASFNGGDFADTGLSSAKGSGTFSYTPASMTDGTYAFYTRATDVAGNIEAVPGAEDASIMVDRVKPSSQCSVAAGTMVNSFPIPISYSSSDASSGVKQVRLYYRLDAGEWELAASLTEASGSYDFTPETVKDGYYEFYTRAYDNASNSETTSGSDCGVTVDTTRPRSSASSPASVTQAPFNVTFEARDDGSGVANTALWYRFNSGDWTDTGLTKTGTAGNFGFNAPDGQGTYQFYTLCTDNAGNLEAAPSSADSETVYSVPTPDISADKASLEFGEVTVGEEGASRVRITNVGDGDLKIDTISATDPVFEPEYSGSLPITLGPDDSLDIDVVFAPDDEGEFEADLEIDSNDSDTPTLIVGLTGEGVEVSGEFTVEISANSDSFAFGDVLEVDLAMLNTDDPVTVDLYAVLTFDLGGSEEKHWSASATGSPWIEGLAPVVTNFYVETGFDLGLPWLASELPCQAPMVSRSGTYTLRMAAVEPGTLDLVSNLSIFEFGLTGEPFVGVSTDKGTYAADETVSVFLDVALPDYSMTADFYAVVMAPDGQFWSPTGFGVDVEWQSIVLPLLPAFETPAGFNTTLEAFVINLPAAAPFDATGQFALFAAVVEPGTLTPFSDMGTAAFTLQ